jgi:hypothetical protein
VQQFTAVPTAQDADGRYLAGMPFRESAARFFQVPELQICGLCKPRKPL